MTRAQQLAARLALALAALASKPLSAHPSWGIVVDPSGQVYFSDLETVWRIDPLGRLSVARAGVSGRHVHELAIDDQGNVYGPDYEYVSETASFRTALWRLDSSGRVTYTVSPGRALPRGASIWRDGTVNTYSVEEDNHLKRETLLVKRSARGEVTPLAVADFQNRRVLKLTASGVGSVVLRSDPPWSPTGVALAPNGDLHILEFGFEPPGTWLKPRVRKLSSRGVTTTEAVVK